MLGIVKTIKEINNARLGNIGQIEGRNGSRLGMTQILNALREFGEYDGYKITTQEHEFNILIDNGQCCCENWGYFASEDDFSQYIGKELKEVNLTDTALNKEKAEENGAYGYEEGGIQFVDFVFTDGDVLQFAVYNEHNGYYGHGIIFAKDTEILLQDTL